MLYDLLIQPFAEFGFMKRTLVACVCLALSGGPLGTLLVLRRMSLMGDAMSHALLPGAAIGFAIAGYSLSVMSLGAFVAAISVALVAGWLSRVTSQKEDASFAAFYLIALAAGVMLVSANGTAVDVLHLLFGSALAVDNSALLGMAVSSTVTLSLLALLYRPLIVECFDPEFLRASRGPGTTVHLCFLVLVVLHLVAGFLALGTMMAVGLLMLPAISARLWAQDVGAASLAASILAIAAALIGLLLSYHLSLPTGPCIVLTAGTLYGLSLLLGSNGSWLSRQRALRSHREA